MDKLWVVAFKDIRTRFTDRRLLIIMFAAPLAIATIIGLAFGGLGRSGSPVSHIPVAVINYDQPNVYGISYGVMLSSLFTEGQLPADTNSSLAACPQNASQSDPGSNWDSMTLAELIQGTEFNEAVAHQLIADKKIEIPSLPIDNPDYLSATAKAAVDKGLFTAVMIIPVDFSTALTSLADPTQPQAITTITVYGNAGDSLSAGIVHSVVNSITAQMISGNVAIGATMSELAKQQQLTLAAPSSLDTSKLFACAFSPGNDLVQLAEMPVQAAPTSTAGALLVTFGSAQALFFVLFTGQNGILSMYEERKNWTLQRILASPTPHWTILGGKLVGVLVSVLFQLFVLALALTLVASLIDGHFAFIWGTDLVKLGLVFLAVAVAVSGLGIFLAGVLKGLEQANIVVSVLNMVLGILGGAFGFQLPRSVAQFSLIYWARNAFDLLASGRGDIWLNILVLFVEGAFMFGIGLFFFNRKFDV